MSGPNEIRACELPGVKIELLEALLDYFWNFVMALFVGRTLLQEILTSKRLVIFILSKHVLQGNDMRSRFHIVGVQFIQLIDILDDGFEVTTQPLAFRRRQLQSGELGDFIDIEFFGHD
jgi:hypothetical protein